MRPSARAAWLLLALPLCACAAIGQGRSRACITAKDLTVQALERVSANSPNAVVEDALLLLKTATGMCRDAGDAWYYQSVMQTKLGQDSSFAHDRAALIGSDAMQEGLNPFVLATPASTSSAPVPRPATPGTRWALVIGVGKFNDSSVDPLKYTTADANLFAASLKDPAVGNFPADHVRVLLDEKATTRDIKAGLNWIARQAQPEDTVVVYVATHGSARDLDAVGGVNYLITADTEVGPAQDQDALFGSALPMIELVDTVATRIRALRTAIFIDTCYSGSVKAGDQGPRANSLDARMLNQIRQGSGRIIMAASRDNEESLQSDKLGHGYFTYYLAQSLQSAPGKPLSEIFGAVQHEVSTNVAADYKAYHLTQVPVLSRSSEQTDFSLGKPRAPGGDAAAKVSGTPPRAGRR